MQRNRNVDIVRAAALLMILIYHSWVLTGSFPFPFSLVTLLVSLGGEVGVTCFFMLSGFGIYCSLRRMDEKGTFTYRAFMSRRLQRILPNYWLSLTVAVVLLEEAAYLSSGGIKSVVTHFLLIHNWFPDCSGTINGALWTMGTIVQFYLIAPFLYKGIKRFGLWFGAGSVLFTVLAKAIAYAWILPRVGGVGSLEFFVGRQQLFTTLDNFVLGMVSAHYVQKFQQTGRQKTGLSLIGLLLSLAGLVLVCKVGMQTGIHTHNLSGYTWHSILAILLMILLCSVSMLKDCKNCRPVKWLLWLSTYEYGIYLWHMLIILNLQKHSPWIQGILNSSHPKLVYLPLVVISIGVGACMQYLTDHSANFADIFKVH